MYAARGDFLVHRCLHVYAEGEDALICSCCISWCGSSSRDLTPRASVSFVESDSPRLRLEVFMDVVRLWRVFIHSRMHLEGHFVHRCCQACVDGDGTFLALCQRVEPFLGLRIRHALRVPRYKCWNIQYGHISLGSMLRSCRSFLLVKTGSTTFVRNWCLYICLQMCRAQELFLLFVANQVCLCLACL